MPFVNLDQMRACFAKKDPKWNCKKWAKETPNIKNLPREKKKEDGGLISKLGYKDNSPYNTASSLDINSPEGLITMQGVSKPLIGIGLQSGEQQLMLPGQEYKFNDTKIKEIPLEFKQGGFKLNPAHKGDCTPMTKSTCTGKKRQFALNAKNHFKKHKKEEGGFISLQEGGAIRKVDKAPDGYTFVRKDGNKNFYNKKDAVGALAMAQPSTSQGGEQYEQFLQQQLSKGISPEELVNKKYLSPNKAPAYAKYFKPTEDNVYTEEAQQIAAKAPLDVPTSAGRGQAIYLPNKHIAGEIFYPSRDSKAVTDAGGINTAQSAAHIKFRNDFGYDGNEVDVDGPELQKYLGVSHTFPTTDAYEQLRKRSSIAKAKLQVGGFAQRQDTNLSYLPLFANSIAQALATKVQDNREQNYIQGNLANPLNYIPRTDTHNDYQNYGTPIFQEGGIVEEDETDDGSDYEDLQDEDFLFKQQEAAQPIAQEEVSPAQIEAPLEQEFQTPIDESTFQASEDTDDSDEGGRISSKALSKLVLNKPSTGLDNEIAQVESGGDYRAENPHSSAVGKYQFLWSQWGDAIKRSTGVSSKEEFKNNPDAQEKFYSEYKQNILLPQASELQKYNSQGLGFNQLAKLVHFKGAGGAKKYLTKGIDDTRANNISISKYIGK